MKITSEFCPQINRHKEPFSRIALGAFFVFEEYLFLKVSVKSVNSAIGLGLTIAGKSRFNPRQHYDFEQTEIVNPVGIEINVFHE